MTTPISSVVYYLISLWLLAGIVFALHRGSTWIGIFPLNIFLGGLLVVMQLGPLGSLTFETAIGVVKVGFGSFLLLPILLLGVLTIYIVNGTSQARSLMIGLIGVTLLVAVYKLVQDYLPVPIIVRQPSGSTIGLTNPRLLLASSIGLAVDFVVLTIVYQFFSNAREQYPSRLAGVLALLAALWTDALFYPALAFVGSPGWWQNILLHLMGKTISGLALMLVATPYLYRVASTFPNTAATGRRPTLGIFTTAEKVEARARYHYSLLRTVSQINQLIVRTTDAKTLLQHACNELLDQRSYRSVWIVILEEQGAKPALKAHAGLSDEQAEGLFGKGLQFKFHQLGLSGQRLVINDVAREKDRPEQWKQTMRVGGCRTAGIFPLRYAGSVMGLMGVCIASPNALDTEESDLLQELADDLAYALISLEAREQQAILQIATQTIQDGFLITDLDGKIIFANLPIEKLTGKNQRELIGTRIGSLLSPVARANLPKFLAKLKQEKETSLEFAYQTFDQRDLILGVRASLVSSPLEHPLYIVAIIRDNTQERRYEQQLLTLHNLTTELVQIHDPQDLMHSILQLSEELLGADASVIYLVNAETRQIINALVHNLSAEYTQRIAQSQAGLPGETAWKTLKPVFVNDTLNDETYGERIHFMAEYDIRSLVILPILSREYQIGALTVYYQHPHTFTEAELQLGLTLSQTLAIVIQNARFYQAEIQQRNLAEALANAAASINSSLDLEEVLSQILDQVMRVVHCTAANIMLVKNDLGYIHAHRGYQNLSSMDVSGVTFPLSTYNLAHMIQENKPYLISDTAQDPNWEVVAGSEWVKGYIGIPLKAGQNVIGFLNIDSDQAGFFTEETINQLRIFVDYATTAIINARLYKTEHSQRELAEALAQAAASVSSSLELTDVLEHILEQSMRVVPCQAANIMLIEKQKVKLVQHRGYENFLPETSDIDNAEFPIDWPSLQAMYLQGQPVIMSDTAQDSRWQTASYANWIRSFIGLPLIVDDQVVGFLNIDSDQPNTLTSDDILPLQTFANYASTAIKNARAYENSRQRAQEMAALVTAASAVSKSLDFRQVLKIIAEQMTKVLQVEACAISNYDPKANQVSLLMEYAPDDWEISAAWYQPYDLDQYPLTRQVLENHEPMHLRLSDPNLDESERNFLVEAEAESLLMLPLISQDRVIGLVELLDTQKERDFSVREIALGLSLASHAASAIENADLYRRLQEYATELEHRVDKRTRQLQAATESIEGILASVPDAIFVLDQNQELVRANQAGERLISRAQTSGANLFDPELLQNLEMDYTPVTPSILQVGSKSYQVLASQLTSNEDQTDRHILLFRDVTHFQELDQMKTRFVSDVSHELRTPLTNLTLYLSLLTTVHDPQKQNDYILTLQRETERLTHLIEDLLTISRLEASRVAIQIRPTNINQLVENLIWDRSVFAAQKNISLDFTPTEDLPLAAADGNLLTQALSNLLTNAINYTLPGGKINAHTLQPAPNRVAIQISDTGVGIPPEEAEHIFDRFYRGQASQQTGAEGTGLGLAISEEIVHRLGGKITLESTPGQGSTFTIELKTATTNML